MPPPQLPNWIRPVGLMHVSAIASVDLPFIARWAGSCEQLINSYYGKGTGQIRPPMAPGGSLRRDAHDGDRSAGSSYFLPERLMAAWRSSSPSIIRSRHSPLHFPFVSLDGIFFMALPPSWFWFIDNPANRADWASRLKKCLHCAQNIKKGRFS